MLLAISSSPRSGIGSKTSFHGLLPRTSGPEVAGSSCWMKYRLSGVSEPAAFASETTCRAAAMIWVPAERMREACGIWVEESVARLFWMSIMKRAVGGIVLWDG